MMSDQAKDFMAWIGGNFYSRESFIDEARKMGVCRRVPFVPEGIVLGESRVLLISDMSGRDREVYNEELKRREAMRYKQVKESKRSGITDISTHVSGPMPRGTPTIFAYFIIQNIIYVTGPDVEIPKRLKKLGVTEYRYFEGVFGFNNERESGSLQIGGTYLLGETNMERIRDLARSGSFEGRIMIPHIVYPYGDKRFRGIKAISIKMSDRLVGVEG